MSGSILETEYCRFLGLLASETCFEHKQYTDTGFFIPSSLLAM
jgi:hypothetical protein